MALDLLRECVVHGPALPEPFVRDDLERELARAALLPGPIALDGLPLLESFEQYRRALRLLRGRGGPIWVRNHAIAPLVARLGYASLGDAGQVTTREGDEDGGALLTSDDGLARLRVFCTDFEADLDAPARRGEAYRYSPLRSAQRVLLQCGERLGLLTNGVELRLLISDAARPDSQIVIPLEPGWKRRGPVPDSYKLLLSLATPKGLTALPALIEKARLQQTRVTKDLRRQAREAVERFLQEVLDHPDNQARLAAEPDKAALARALWHEGLVTVYRLLFVLSLEASDNPARSFRFASASLWRGTFSPTLGLGLGQHPGVTLRQQIDDILEGRRETGRFLEDGLRQLFRVFAEGLSCSGLTVRPLGGALFGAQATPWLTALRCGERAVAHLLDRLLWTPARKGAGRQRVHYGPLDVEDLGRVYEALLELEPGIAVEPMCRLRRQKLEVVVPLQQGERYRPQAAPAPAETTDAEDEEADAEEPEEADAEAEGERAPARAGKTRVEWVEEIPSGRFYLRVGLGRKATGSYYTPTSFVRFLVRETLGPQVTERSPDKDPRPLAILGLRVLDPAMGSGHFLVEACRFLGDRRYEACRQCDELAAQAEEQARASRDAAERAALQARAVDLWGRVEELPDPNNVLLAYLPSRAPEGQQSGVSLREAEALCKRLVAVHCLYGVDKNPLAVELARLCLWIESHAEGLPLTFLDHRLVRGDSLTGPFFEHLRKRPGTQEPLEDLFGRGLAERLEGALGAALQQVRALEASVGTDVADTQQKEGAKARLDCALAALRVVAAAWSGGVMLGKEGCDDPAYEELVRVVGKSGELPALLSTEKLAAMVARGLGVAAVPRERDALLGVVLAGEGVPALSYDLTFPEVFYPEGKPGERRGFDAVLGNPPWDALQPLAKEFFAAYDFGILSAPTRKERQKIEEHILRNKEISKEYAKYSDEISKMKHLVGVLYSSVNRSVGKKRSGAVLDCWQIFAERSVKLIWNVGFIGLVVPGGFHGTESATGIRRLYIDLGIMVCFSF